jgi:hypothetical protein
MWKQGQLRSGNACEAGMLVITEMKFNMTDNGAKTFSRTVKAGLACALLLGLAACQTDGNRVAQQKPAPATAPSSSPWSCTTGSIHWGKVQQKQVLVAASQLVKATSSMKGTSVKFSAIPVRTVRAAVQSTAKVDGETVLTSLEKKSGLPAGDLARPGKSVPLEAAGGDVAINLQGQNKDYVSAIGATVMEASFVYGCASSTTKPVYGTVTTWHKPIAGLLECGTDPKSAYAREAYSLLCGEKGTAANASPSPAS